MARTAGTDEVKMDETDEMNETDKTNERNKENKTYL
jgi:hypothetical protein